MSTTSRSTLRKSALFIALAASALTAGCAQIPARVWYNGRGMQNAWQYDAFMAGEVNPAILKGLYYSADARRIAYTPRYSPFGDW